MLDDWLLKIIIRLISLIFVGIKNVLGSFALLGNELVLLFFFAIDRVLLNICILF